MIYWCLTESISLYNKSIIFLMNETQFGVFLRVSAFLYSIYINYWNVFLMNRYSTFVIFRVSPFKMPIIKASDLFSLEPLPPGSCFKYYRTSSIFTLDLWSLAMNSYNWILVKLSIGSTGYMNSYLKTSSKCLIEW